MSKHTSRLIPILLFLALIMPMNETLAESSFFDTTTEIISETVDFSSKNSIDLTATDIEPKVCSITFDFTEGNQTIVLVEESACKVYYYFDDNELLSIVFHMMTKFNQMSSVLPEGYSLQYILRFSDTEVYCITSETLSKYYSWNNK